MGCAPAMMAAVEATATVKAAERPEQSKRKQKQVGVPAAPALAWPRLAFAGDALSATLLHCATMR